MRRMGRFGGRRENRAAAWIAVLLALALIPALVLVSSAVARRRSVARHFDYCLTRHAVFSEPRAWVGITDPFVEVGSEGYRDCSFGLMAAEHVGYFRGGLIWSSVQYAPGQRTFAFFDGLIGDLARHHIRFLPLLLGAPKWASTAPAQGAAPGLYPPADPDQFAQFAAMCVARYGPHGTFWRLHPGLPYYPVRAWEIWNEPNTARYWEPRPDPAGYARLLRAAYTAIKHVDPHATVVTAGMPFADRQAEVGFLSRMFRAGARGAFDALAIHPYSSSVSAAIAKLRVARTVMKRFGAGDKPLWVTEISWPGGGARAYIANQRGQAQSLADFFDRVHEDRALRVREIFWYGWRDPAPGPGPGSPRLHLGLFTAKLRPKLALGALAAVAARLDRAN